MVCVGGGIDINRLVEAAACCVCGLVPGGGRGGVVWGWHCWGWGGRGWVLCWLGVWASFWVVWVLLLCAARSLRPLAGCGAEVWLGGGRMGVRVGLWSVCYGWLLVPFPEDFKGPVGDSLDLKQSMATRLGLT